MYKKLDKSMTNTVGTKLIQQNNQPLYGDIQHPISEVNYQDYDLRTPMDKPIKGIRKYAAFNQFQFVGLMSENLIAGIAIVNLKWVSNVFIYVYDLKTHKLVERSFLQPLAASTSIGLNPDTGKSSFSQWGNRVDITTNGDGSERYLYVKLGKEILINATLLNPPAYRPLRVCSKAGYNGWVFTQKSAGLAVEGNISWEGKQYTLLKEEASASVDWSCGFMRRETAWNWACFSGLMKDGRRIGLNLAAGVNETGVTENCLWVDGVLTKLNMAVFEFDRYNPEKQWGVKTTDGLLELTFQPFGRREEKIDVIFIASNFKQMFGHFSGWMIDGAGERIELDAVPGFMEDHYAKW